MTRRLALSLALFAACSGGTHHGVGTVTDVDPAHGQLMLAHEAIPGLMPAMTMTTTTPFLTRTRTVTATPTLIKLTVIETGWATSVIQLLPPYVITTTIATWIRATSGCFKRV